MFHVSIIISNSSEFFPEIKHHQVMCEEKENFAILYPCVRSLTLRLNKALV